LKVLSIVNPVSGSKKAVDIYDQLKLEEKGLLSTPFITTHPGHAREILQHENLEKYAAVIIFGGDGTIHEVVNGMISREDGIKKPLGVIPLGTGNALMHDLEILTVKKALFTILNQKKISMDLMKCDMPDQILYSFNIVGWGMPQSINQIAEKLRFLGKQRYNLASLYEIIRNPQWDCIIKIDNEKIKGRFSFVLACNNQFTGNGMKIAPRASFSDGKIDILLFKSLPRHKLVQLFLKVFSGKHIDHPDIIYRQAGKIEIQPSIKMPLNIDGQQTGNAPITINILPQEVELFISS
jgi:sphingosine kinase